MLAARFYHLAFSLIHKDATVSYIFLVSAIESLLHDYDIDNAVLEDWNAKAAKLIKKEVKDDNKYKEIEQIIMSKSVRIKKRFISFIKSHLTEKILVGSYTT